MKIPKIPNEIKIGVNYNENTAINQIFIDKLKDLLKTSDVEPAYIPNNLIDCIRLYKSGTTYRVYFYIDNTWKYATLS